MLYSCCPIVWKSSPLAASMTANTEPIVLVQVHPFTKNSSNGLLKSRILKAEAVIKALFRALKAL